MAGTVEVPSGLASAVGITIPGSPPVCPVDAGDWVTAVLSPPASPFPTTMPPPTAEGLVAVLGGDCACRGAFEPQATGRKAKAQRIQSNAKSRDTGSLHSIRGCSPGGADVWMVSIVAAGRAGRYRKAMSGSDKNRKPI